ncbi:hypothetical protein Tco_0826962 [Tanacetum coccineum]
MNKTNAPLLVAGGWGDVSGVVAVMRWQWWCGNDGGSAVVMMLVDLWCSSGGCGGGAMMMMTVVSWRWFMAASGVVDRRRWSGNGKLSRLFDGRMYPQPYLRSVNEELGESINGEWWIADAYVGVELVGVAEGYRHLICTTRTEDERLDQEVATSLNGTSSSAGGHLTQEEAVKVISQTYLWLKNRCNKVELDGNIVEEEEEEVKRIKGEALKEKNDPGAFIFPIRLEGQVNENALADTRSDINTMPYWIYEQLGREEMKKVDRGITMIISLNPLFTLILRVRYP